MVGWKPVSGSCVEIHRSASSYQRTYANFETQRGRMNIKTKKGQVVRLKRYTEYVDGTTGYRAESGPITPSVSVAATRPKISIMG